MVTVHVVLRMILISVIIPHHHLAVAVVVEVVHQARHKHLVAVVAALLHHRQVVPQAVVATGTTMDTVPMAPLVMDHTMMTNGQMTGGIRTI